VTIRKPAGDHDTTASRGARVGLTVRPARAGDAPALAALSTELGYPAQEEQIERRLKALLAGDDDVVFVAEGAAGAGAVTAGAEGAPGAVSAGVLAGAQGQAQGQAQAQGQGRRPELLGFVHAAEKRLLVSEPFVELEGLIVAAAARRHGAAAALVDAVERWSLARGVGELRVRARLERDVADRFYRGRGFELEKKQRVFSKRLT
jgi:ribosomal protein S18 acetylase RimI-like enzyme